MINKYQPVLLWCTYYLYKHLGPIQSQLLWPHSFLPREHSWPRHLCEHTVKKLKHIENQSNYDPFGQHQESRPLASPNLLSMLRVLVLYSQPIRWRLVRDSRTSGFGTGQRSRFLVRTKRIVASGDENDWMANHHIHDFRSQQTKTTQWANVVSDWLST